MHSTYAAQKVLNDEVRLRLLDRMVAESNQGLIIADEAATILYINAAFTALTNYRRDEVIGGNMRIMHSGLQDKAFYAELWKSLITEGRWVGGIWNRRKSGERFLAWLNITAVHGESGQGTYYIGTFSDISSLRAREHQLEQLAYYDPLTSLPNRLLFRDRFQQCLAQVERNKQGLALLYLDLDKFKEMNDRHGHLLGDQLLCEVAVRLQSNVRKGDTVARMSGDEFVIVLPGMDVPDRAIAVAEKILTSMREPYVFSTPGVCTSASIGISQFPGDGTDLETLLTHADFAMYGAKEKGGNRIQLYRELHTRIPPKKSSYYT